MNKSQQPAAMGRRPSGKKAPRKPKILRACVVESGKVIEEKRLRQKQAVTIGTGPKNTFVISDPSLPRNHTLFDVKGGKYELVFTEAMRGKVTGEGAPADFAELKSKGSAKKKGSLYHLPLSEKHRGKVVVGGVTIIFQFVVPPPAPARPRLPAAAKGSLLKSVDWTYAGILGLVMVLEAPVLISFQFVEIPKQLTLDQVDSRFADLIIPDYETPEPEEETPKEKGDSGDAKAKVAKARDEGPEDEEARAKAKAVRSAKIRKSIAGKGILAILGTAGEGSSGGAVADVFGSGSGLGGDLDAAFEGIAGVGLATAGSGTTTRGGGSGEAASIGGLATAGGGKVGLGGKAERRVRGKVSSGGGPDVDGALDSAAIARVVRGRMRSIQMCYERELKRDPSLSGKIEIEFTISENGRIEEALIASNQMGSSAVGNCIVNLIRRWRFPKPDGGSVTVSYPFIFTSSS